MIEVAIVGAAGYAGIEAVRWVLAHPELQLVCATSAADAGRRIDEVYPAFSGLTDLEFSDPDVDAICLTARVAVLAVPHTAAMAVVPQLLARGLTVIDLSADFRLTDPGIYTRWYEVEHTAPELLAQAVYGLPEFDRTGLPGARLVACPGCYPTAAALAALPALEAGVALGSRIVVDAKSGVSGAGRSPSASTHFVAAAESMLPYKVGGHRHTPEMEQVLGSAAGRPVSVMFTPHLVPLVRGLLATVYMEAEPGLTTAQAVELYRGRYHAEPFVHVHPAGSMPSTGEVRGTNRASVGVHVDEQTGTMVAVCAIDNLGKGASGQGIQCLNAVLGLPEKTGLSDVGPVV